MSNGGILNADMATVGRWLRQGLGWWIGELATMVPARMRERGTRTRRIALYDGCGHFSIVEKGQRIDLPAGSEPRVLDIALPASSCLIRDIAVPRMRAADLRGFVHIEAERLLPLPAREWLIDAMILDRQEGDGRMLARIAALPRTTAEEALEAASVANLQLARLGIVDGGDPRHARFDFAPALRAEGRIAASSNDKAVWWGLVAFAFLFNLGLLVLRDQQSVERLSAIVDVQAPAVSIARTIARRVERADVIQRTTIVRRTRHDALGNLAAVTRAVPDTAWTQRYLWDGQTLRVAGYAQRKVDMIAALRRAPIVTNVHSTNADIVGDIPIGQPFDISADLKEPHR